MSLSKLVDLQDPSQVGEARRQAVALARSLGSAETVIANSSIVVTELATNILKHAGSGALVLRGLREDEGGGLEILALDQGPGIENVGESLRDGYSTAGSPGTGLGAIQRLSSLFEVYSQPSQGLAVLTRVGGKGIRSPLVFGAVCLPISTEMVGGDAWGLSFSPPSLLMAVDGLGHGLYASEVAVEALRIFHQHPAVQPMELIERLHGVLRSTRGAAVAAVGLSPAAGQVSFAGVGNIYARISSASGTRNLVSFNGIVGAEVRKIQQFEYPWAQDALLILHSDGLSASWKLDDYPGLSARHPALIAGVLYRDHNRPRDDSLVMVLRNQEGIPE